MSASKQMSKKKLPPPPRSQNYISDNAAEEAPAKRSPHSRSMSSISENS